MKKFRKKDFSEIIKDVKSLVKRSPILPISTLSLGVASTNLALNQKRKKQDEIYQREQLDAMKRLTNSLNKVDKSLEKSPTNKPNTIIITSEREKDNGKSGTKFILNRKIFSKAKKFRKKEFSILSDTISGASIGASIGTLGSVFAPKKIKSNKFVGKDIKNKYNDLKAAERKLAVVGAGTLVGAALGALVGLIKEGDKFISRSNVDKRLMNTVVENLKKQSFKEGVDFTRDPKIADQLSTKVCIVITKYSGDLRILINTILDKKLDSITNQVIKNIQNTSVINKKASNNYNDITISTISDGSADAGLITGICEQFIHSGYPVYLVEVG